MTEEKLQAAINLRGEINSLKTHIERVGKVIKSAEDEGFGHKLYLKIEREGLINGGVNIRIEATGKTPIEFLKEYLSICDDLLKSFENRFTHL